MTIETIPGTDIEYTLLSYDQKGVERREGAQLMSARLVERVASGDVSNIFFFCHGWKGDVPAARDQYGRWMGAFMRSADLQRAKETFSDFSPLLVGLHWPSQPWGDEEVGEGNSFAISGAAPVERLLRSYLDILGDDPAIRAPLEIIFEEARRNAAPSVLPAAVRNAYLDLNRALGLESRGVAAPPDADREGFDPDEATASPQNFSGLELGGILSPLRQLSYWTMKKRARTIGEGGMHAFLKGLMEATAERGTRIHLMGHSFGTIVVSSMVSGPDARGVLPRAVDSLVLVQGAVSLWCYAAKIPFDNEGPGYYHRVFSDQKVSGPIVVTKSIHDTAVGKLYPFASRLNGSVEFAAGTLPEFGALGAFGLQGVVESSCTDMQMLDSDGRYSFAKSHIYNLESSRFIAKGGGASGAHNDIDGPQVAHAIWEAALASS